jgi:hypothetical protein
LRGDGVHQHVKQFLFVGNEEALQQSEIVLLHFFVVARFAYRIVIACNLKIEAYPNSLSHFSSPVDTPS